MSFEWLLISPYPTSIIFRASYNGITLIIELTGKYLILMALKHLNHFSTFSIPQTGRTIKTSWKNLCSLGIKHSFRYLSLMTL